MVSFRKLFPVLAVIGLLLTASTASAQLSCNTVNALEAGRLLRSEGLAELVSPIVIQCKSSVADGQVLRTGGAPAGFAGNFRIVLSQNVTSTKTAADKSTVFVRLRAFENGSVAIDPSGTNAALSTDATAIGSAVQGTLSSDNTVDWSGVSLQYSAAATTLTVVIDNIRVNASGVASAFTPVTATVQAVSFGDVTSPFNINKDVQVGVIQNSISGGKVTLGTGDPATNGKATITQCTGATTDPTGSSFAATSAQTRVVVKENFGNAFRTAELTSYEAGTSGFEQHGTFIVLKFQNVPSGVKVFVGNGALSGLGTGFNSGLALSGASSTTGFTAVTLDAAGTGTVTYEVTSTDPAVQESYAIPVAYQFSAGAANLGTAQVAANLGPIDTNEKAIADKTLAVRFKDMTSGNFVSILDVTACSTTLLFPYVTSSGGWDTGIAIANTTADVKTAGSNNFLFGQSDKTKAAASQSGTCTLYYFGAPTTAAATTAVAVPAGTTYLMTLSGGSVNEPNAFNVAGVAGFTGYMIAQCNFQNAHGFAFLNGTASSGSAGVGYTALVMNAPAPATVSISIPSGTAGGTATGTITYPARITGSNGEGFNQ